MARLVSVLDEGSVLGPLKVIVNGMDKLPLPTFMEAVADVDAAGYIADVVSTAASIYETAQDQKTFGDLKDDPVDLEGVACIMQYTAEATVPAFYEDMNTRCNKPNRVQSKAYGKYLWLLVSSLKKIPPFEGRTIFRGVAKQLRDQYAKGRKITWHSVASCTRSIEVLENPEFLGKSGPRTIFTIELTLHQARDITRYSLVKGEDEIILPPGSRFEVLGVLSHDDGLTQIQLREVKSHDWLLDLSPDAPESPALVVGARSLLESVRASPSLLEFEMCKKHDDPMKLWCDTCKVAICRDCTVKDHKNHDFDFFAAKFESHSADMKARVGKLESHREEAGTALKEVAASRKALLDRHEEVKEEVASQFDKQIKAMQDTRDKLLLDIDKSVAEDLAKLDSQTESLQNRQDEAERCHAEASAAFLNGSDDPYAARTALQSEAKMNESLTAFAAEPCKAKPVVGATIKLEVGTKALGDAIAEFIQFQTNPGFGELELDLSRKHPGISVSGNAIRGTSGSVHQTILSKQVVSSGQFAWEVKVVKSPGCGHITLGITAPSADLTQSYQYSNCGHGVEWRDGHVFVKGSVAASIPVKENDLAGFRLDMDAKSLQLFRNGSLVHTVTGLTGSAYCAAFCVYQSTGEFAVQPSVSFK